MATVGVKVLIYLTATVLHANHLIVTA